MPARFPILLVLAACLGCAGGNVKVSYDRQTNFAQYKTYRFDEGQQFGIAGRTIGGQSLTQIILLAAQRDLESKGLQRIDEGAADVIVRYDTTLDFQQVQVPVNGRESAFQGRDDYSDASPAPPLPPPAEVPETIAQVTLRFDMVDARSNRSVWSGTGTGRVPQTVPPDQRRRRLEELVSAILAKFPPKGAR